MNDTFLADLKHILDKCISELSSDPSPFCVNPETNFTRVRKIRFEDIIYAILQFQSKSMPNELLDYFGHSFHAPTSSAFNQQRDKILTDAWHFLFQSFCSATSGFQNRLFRGYRLLACDGSDVNIARNPSDEETFIPEGEKGYNMIHINALYDLLNHTYVDVVFQGKKKSHERQAFNTMVDRCPNDVPTIYIADRGYESYNTIVHAIQQGQKFIIRTKDITSNGILSKFNCSDGEFDCTVSTILTRRHTKETKNNPEKYTILQSTTDFDFLDETTRYFPVEFRVVRFKTDNGYICVVTNLPEEEFTSGEIIDLYRLRWGEEGSFRELKYTIGLVNFHSRKKNFIEQEILARLILYNFCELATCHAAETRTANNKTKHTYRINFSTAVNICRAYLRDGGDETEQMLLIQRHLTPIRDDRNYPVKLHPKRNRDFMYRAA